MYQLLRYSMKMIEVQ